MSRAQVSLSLLAAGLLAVGILVYKNVNRSAPGPVPDQRGDLAPGKETPRPQATTLLPIADRPPTLWALLVGIDSYQDPAIPACHGADADAQALAQWFTETAGWPADHVLRLGGSGPAVPPAPGAAQESPGTLLATRANLDWAVDHWLLPRLGPRDVVVIYYGGQTAIEPVDEAQAIEAGGDEFLLPIDGRLASPARTGWDLVSALDRLAARGSNGSRVCWLDTSLLGRGRRVIPDDVETPPSSRRFLQRLSRWPGSTAWIAADGQLAGESQQPGQRGPFLEALLSALGTRQQPVNLLGCLRQLNADPIMRSQGFRSMGAVLPSLELWSAPARERAALARELLLQRGHANPVLSLTFTADGSRLISAGNDSVVKLWRVEDRRLLRALPYHLVGVSALALRSDGRRLISGDASGRLRVWDMSAQNELPSGPSHEAGVASIGHLPNSAMFATLDLDGTAWLWNAAQLGAGGQVIASEVSGLAASPSPGTAALVLARLDGKLQLHGSDGRPGPVLEGPAGVVTSQRLSTNGKLIACVGNSDQPRLLVRDAAGGETLLDLELDAPAQLVKWLPTGSLAVAAGQSLRVFPFIENKSGDPQSLELPAPAAELATSFNGQQLAACTTGGDLLAWKHSPLHGYVPQDLEAAPGPPALATAVALSPDGQTLVAGDQDGGLRFWWLVKGKPYARINPRRGQVAGLDITPDGRYLLQVTHDRRAQVWDLEEGRSLNDLGPGWLAGALVADGSSAVLLTSVEGDPVEVNRVTARKQDQVFERPETAGVPCRFGTLALSPDPESRLVAAGTVDGPLEGPLACVWERATGKLLHVLRGHEDPFSLTAVDFSPDGTQLLTASEDGTVRLWPLRQDSPAPEALQVWTISSELDDPSATPITAASFHPRDPTRVLAGTGDGRLLRLEVGQEKAVELSGRFDAAIRSLSYSRDGAYAAAAGGLDKNLRLWSLDGPQAPLRLDPAPNHQELIRAVVAAPTADVLITGSDDTTIRFWNLADRTLLGTLSAEQDSPDWVAFTPEGLFDSSIGGESQISWLVGEEVLPLDQFEERSRVFQLTSQLRKGERPKPPEPPTADPPRIVLQPPAAPVSDSRDLELTLLLDETPLQDVRLYHDGVPVALAEDLGLVDASTRKVQVPVRLVSGSNRFYAMATRADAPAPDGRSNLVEVVYNGPESAGRVHILSLGVSNYQVQDRALQYADNDAEALADFVHRNGAAVEGEPGILRVLTNESVSEETVDAAFRDIRDAVTGHPEDTVMIFLAGHTDVLANRFFLLLGNFDFPAAGAVFNPLNLEAGSVLPYSTLYRNLARLSALQRLVIVDACQSEAIQDDPAVRRIRESIDSGAHRAKTAYFLAARRGEPAGEVSALEHGLLTYVLLRGMGRRDLKLPPEVEIFNQFNSADRNLDQSVSTDELSWFADVTLPPLAASFPQVVMRQGVSDPAQAPPSPRPDLEQSLRLQAADVSFPLVRIPRP